MGGGTLDSHECMLNHAINPEGYDGTPQCYALCIKHSGGAKRKSWKKSGLEVVSMDIFHHVFFYVHHVLITFTFIHGGTLSRCQLFFQRDLSTTKWRFVW